MTTTTDLTESERAAKLARAAHVAPLLQRAARLLRALTVPEDGAHTDRFSALVQTARGVAIFDPENLLGWRVLLDVGPFAANPFLLATAEHLEAMATGFRPALAPEGDVAAQATDPVAHKKYRGMTPANAVRAFLRTVRDATAEEIAVKTGLSSDEIVAGLSGDDIKLTEVPDRFRLEQAPARPSTRTLAERLTDLAERLMLPAHRATLRQGATGSLPDVDMLGHDAGEALLLVDQRLTALESAAPPRLSDAEVADMVRSTPVQPLHDAASVTEADMAKLFAVAFQVANKVDGAIDLHGAIRAAVEADRASRAAPAQAPVPLVDAADVSSAPRPARVGILGNIEHVGTVRRISLLGHDAIEVVDLRGAHRSYPARSVWGIEWLSRSELEDQRAQAGDDYDPAEDPEDRAQRVIDRGLLRLLLTLVRRETEHAPDGVTPGVTKEVLQKLFVDAAGAAFDRALALAMEDDFVDLDHQSGIFTTTADLPW